MEETRIPGRQLVKDALVGSVVFAAYAATATYGLDLAPVSGFAAPVWAPTGIALAAVLLAGYRMLPAVFLAAVAVNWLQGAPFLAAAGIGIGNALEAAAGAYLFRQLTNDDIALTRLRDALSFIFAAGLTAPLVSASIGVISLWAGGVIVGWQTFETWTAWWIGDVLGALVVTPFLLVWLRKDRRPHRHRRAQPFNLLAWVALALAGSAVFFETLGFRVQHPRSYLIFPPLLWIAVAYGRRGATAAVLLTSVAAVVATSLGLGPFSVRTLSDSLLLLQTFYGVVAASVLLFAVAIAEREEALADAARAQESLTEEVRKQTFLLSESQRLGRVGSREWSLAYDKLLASEGLYKIFGMEPVKGPVPLETFDRAYHPADRDRVRAALADALRDNAPFTLEYRIVRPDGEVRTILERGIPLRDEAGKPTGLFGRAEDVTDRRRTEARLEVLHALRAKFIQIVAHQLRTPLNAMRWNLEALMAGDLGTLKKEQLEFLRLTHQQDLRVISRIHDLLTAMDIEEGRISIAEESVSLEEIWKSVFADYKKSCAIKGIACVNMPPRAPLPAVRGDSQKIRDVFEKLMRNALDYTPEGGRIVTALRRTDGMVRFEVADTGIGIPKYEQPRIFSRFFRGTNAVTAMPDASGLSLFIAKYFIERHGGAIGFKSAEGKGTTFWFELPVRFSE